MTLRDMLIGFRVNTAFKLKLHVMLELKMHDLSIIILIVRVRVREGKIERFKDERIKEWKLRDLKFLFFFHL